MPKMYYTVRPTVCVQCEGPLPPSRTKPHMRCCRCSPGAVDLPPTRSCASCGDSFSPVRRDQEHCSKRCRMREYDRRRYARTAGPPTPDACIACDDVMPGTYPARRRRCLPCSAGTDSPLPWIECESCDRWFLRPPDATAAKFCSDDCRPPAYVPVAGAPIRAICDHCQRPFNTVRSQGRYRCPPCRQLLAREARRSGKRRRARRKRAAGQERYEDRAIFDRDGWRCQLCGGRLGGQPVPHPKAPTIDHIVPIARGGADTPANVQAAHFLCNSRKGDRPANDQLRLVG